MPPADAFVAAGGVERLLRLAARPRRLGALPDVRIAALPARRRRHPHARRRERADEGGRRSGGRRDRSRGRAGTRAAAARPTEWIAELPELGRIRCTSFQDHHGPGVLFRMIATRAATAEQLGLSREVQALATEAEGLVLVAGPRGSGKSTLMSALVDLVNRQRADYVITLERQIRLVHDNRTALVSQREIRGGADEALAAARAALRENPDVLVVDDLELGAHGAPAARSGRSGAAGHRLDHGAVDD